MSKVKVIKTWECAEFVTECVIPNKNVTKRVNVYLEYNHETGAIRLNTPHQEMVSFNNDTIEEAEARMACLQAAMKYLKSIK